MIQFLLVEHMEIIKRVKLCLFCLKTNVLAEIILMRVNVCLVQQAQSTIDIVTNANGVQQTSISMSTMITISRALVTYALQEL